MNHLRKWLLCVIAVVSLTVTACGGDAAANVSVAADVAHAAGNILGSLAEAAENSGAGNSVSPIFRSIRTPPMWRSMEMFRILRRTT